ncbi:MAG: hypothetical protein AAFX93_19760 [Verrucomicrobiota bacterium]
MSNTPRTECNCPDDALPCPRCGKNTKVDPMLDELEAYLQNASDDELIEDLKAVGVELKESSPVFGCNLADLSAERQFQAKAHEIVKKLREKVSQLEKENAELIDALGEIVSLGQHHERADGIAIEALMRVDEKKWTVDRKELEELDELRRVWANRMRLIEQVLDGDLSRLTGNEPEELTVAIERALELRKDKEQLQEAVDRLTRSKLRTDERVERLRADKERLDFMTANPAKMYLCWGNGNAVRGKHAADARKAIDAARKGDENES